MILNLFRRIFGCYTDNMNLPVFILEDDDHTIVLGRETDSEMDDKSEGFVCYSEEAMDNVTGNRYKYIKYRNI